MMEAAETNAEHLVSAMHSALAEHLTHPYFLFGHSMGSLLAALWAQTIQQQGLPQPQAIILSGRSAPAAAPVFPEMDSMSDEALAEALDRRFGGNTGTALLADPELRAHYMPLLRADLKLVDSADSSRFPLPLQAPVVSVRALSDPALSEEKAAAWKDFSAGIFELRTIPGNHFSHFAESEAEMLHLLESVHDRFKAASS